MAVKSQLDLLVVQAKTFRVVLHVCLSLTPTSNLSENPVGLTFKMYSKFIHFWPPLVPPWSKSLYLSSGYFNSFPLVSLLLRLFPVISILHGGLGDPVRTFRSCYSSAQHLSVVYHLNQSKIQHLSKPPICGPIPSDAAFYLLFPSLTHFTTSSLVPCCLSRIAGLLPSQGLPFIVLPMSTGCPRCLCGWFSPLL